MPYASNGGVDYMKIFYGGAIQGAINRPERAHAHRLIIDALKENGCEVLSEHTTGVDVAATAGLLVKSIGPLPADRFERAALIRRQMIEMVEGDIDAAVFEASVPSLGTGIEMAHVYLRPRLGLKPIPVIALYQQDYWPNKLSTMITGITSSECACFEIIEYPSPETASVFIPEVIDLIHQLDQTGSC